MKRCISLDIDGIINDYPETMFKFSRKTFGVEAKNKRELKVKLAKSGINYADFKDVYRRSYECTETESCVEGVNKEFIDFYLKLKNSYDINILFRTSRPEENYPGTLQRTKNWLASQGIDCINVESKDRKSFERYEPILHVDDEIEHLNIHAEYANKSVLLLYSRSSVSDRSGDYKVIRKLDEICLILENLNLQ